MEEEDRYGDVAIISAHKMMRAAYERQLARFYSMHAQSFDGRLGRATRCSHQLGNEVDRFFRDVTLLVERRIERRDGKCIHFRSLADFANRPLELIEAQTARCGKLIDRRG